MVEKFFDVNKDPFRSPHRRVDVNGIFEDLRFRIATLAYKPGQALRETDLAFEFGVSRTPLRQALQRLELAGLVRPIVGKGTIVAPLEVDTIRDALDFRLQLTRVLGPFLNFEEADSVHALIRELQREQEEQTDAIDAVTFARISHESRKLVSRLIDNELAARTWLDTYYIASRAWFIEFEQLSQTLSEMQREELSSLLLCLEERDGERLVLTLQLFLHNWRRALRPVLSA